MIRLRTVFAALVLTIAAAIAPADRTALGVLGWFGRWALFTGSVVVAGAALLRLAGAGRHPAIVDATQRLALVAGAVMLFGAAIELVMM